MSFTMFSKLRPTRKATNATVDIQQSAKHANPLQTISRSSTKVFGGSEPKSEHVAEHTTSSTSSPAGTFNVVLFGETGVGKSSVINLIARKEIAAVSSDVNGCTMQHKCYDIPFDDVNFAIYDTVGLEEPQMGVNGYLKAIEQAYGLINKLGAAGGIHLLLFCLRGGRITATTQSNYRLFRECLCYEKVPIALVFTGLEREAEMEDWWKRNKKDIEGYGIKSDGHACITAVQDDEDDQKFLASQVRIRQLLKECAIKHDPFSPETHPWFARFTRGMKGFIKGKKAPKEKQIMKVLMQRCKLDQETARKVAAMMENGDVEKGEDSRERSEDNEPWKETGPENNPTTLCSSLSEHAAPLAGVLNNESVPNRCDKEDLRAMNGDDEPENGSKAVPGEPPTKENSPRKEHEDPQAGDGEEAAKKLIDQSMPNGHDQKGQQAGTEEGGQAGTGEASTNDGSMLDEHGREEDWASSQRRGSVGRTTETTTQPTKDASLFNAHERVQQTEAVMESLPFPPETHYRNKHPPAGKDESGSCDGQEIGVAKDSTMDGPSSDKNKKPRATKIQGGEKRISKDILTNDDLPQTQKDPLSDGESDWHIVGEKGAGDLSPVGEQNVPGAYPFSHH